MTDAHALQAVIDLTNQHGRLPTTRELARYVGCAPSTAHKHMARLRTQGRYRVRLVSVPSRTCALYECDAALAGHRADARYCCDSHRAEASRRRRAA